MQTSIGKIIILFIILGSFIGTIIAVVKVMKKNTCASGQVYSDKCKKCVEDCDDGYVFDCGKNKCVITCDDGECSSPKGDECWEKCDADEICCNTIDPDSDYTCDSQDGCVKYNCPSLSPDSPPIYCPKGTTCDNGSCVSDAPVDCGEAGAIRCCQEDDDCPTGTTCDNGKCENSSLERDSSPSSPSSPSNKKCCLKNTTCCYNEDGIISACCSDDSPCQDNGYCCKDDSWDGNKCCPNYGNKEGGCCFDKQVQNCGKAGCCGLNQACYCQDSNEKWNPCESDDTTSIRKCFTECKFGKTFCDPETQICVNDENEEKSTCYNRGRGCTWQSKPKVTPDYIANVAEACVNNENNKNYWKYDSDFNYSQVVTPQTDSGTCSIKDCVERLSSDAGMVNIDWCDDGINCSLSDLKSQGITLSSPEQGCTGTIDCKYIPSFNTPSGIPKVDAKSNYFAKLYLSTDGTFPHKNYNAASWFKDSTYINSTQCITKEDLENNIPSTAAKCKYLTNKDGLFCENGSVNGTDCIEEGDNNNNSIVIYDNFKGKPVVTGKSQKINIVPDKSKKWSDTYEGTYVDEHPSSGSVCVSVSDDGNGNPIYKPVPDHLHCPQGSMGRICKMIQPSGPAGSPGPAKMTHTYLPINPGQETYICGNRPGGNPDSEGCGIPINNGPMLVPGPWGNPLTTLCGTSCSSLEECGKFRSWGCSLENDENFAAPTSNVRVQSDYHGKTCIGRRFNCGINEGTNRGGVGNEYNNILFQSRTQGACSGGSVASATTHCKACDGDNDAECMTDGGDLYDNSGKQTHGGQCRFKNNNNENPGNIAGPQTVFGWNSVLNRLDQSGKPLPIIYISFTVGNHTYYFYINYRISKMAQFFDSSNAFTDDTGKWPGILSGTSVLAATETNLKSGKGADYNIQWIWDSGRGTLQSRNGGYYLSISSTNKLEICTCNIKEDGPERKAYCKGHRSCLNYNDSTYGYNWVFEKADNNTYYIKSLYMVQIQQKTKNPKAFYLTATPNLKKNPTFGFHSKGYTANNSVQKFKFTEINVNGPGILPSKMSPSKSL